MTTRSPDLKTLAQQATEAAKLATEAATEAEAAIAARNDAALALDKTAKQTRMTAIVIAAVAVLTLGVGALGWFRASGHLSQAAEVQASASASFVENLMDMNAALDEMKAASTAAQDQANQHQGSVEALIAQLDQRLADLTREAMAAQQDAASANAPVAAAAPDQCGDMLIALAEVELNLTRQLAELPMAVAAPDMTPGARPEAAAPPAPAPAPAQPAASRPAPVLRSAPPPPNPFSFP
ncbi:MAG: Growth arrest and DNA-damage-inducible proteins-interacting protein 1 [Roseibaca calidilacus]|uniref:Growth arrest and DNA-damage-inducible proteins-interacting protein 1 n=1 Tax=Roseibaca calidilacus TaxID=1666912 RepID=A0A0N8K8V0_9RHOB|nr:hypothetical protein [Roseibaca calidilacus]KPP95553.1 MAG: Growth arrest and DNA-damage-inducible proteins-interacting protein 1 [Roseibaca calidilacus]CUX82102.1 hypothetical protein Ga0058931_2167 [Roseibaca calidilacus]